MYLIAGRHGGYRCMTSTLRRRYHLHVSRELVRNILRQVDPSAVSARRSRRLVRRTYWARGPNHIWHVDGYDKLRTYGFFISGSVNVILFV